MKIRLWGTRGSIPSPGPQTVRYGGNTSCVEVRLEDGTLLILDAGTGIRALGTTLGSCEATLLLSHYHWDHIQGLPFFAPAFHPESAIRILGPDFEGHGPGEYLTAQMRTPYFPADPSQLQGVNGFAVAPAEPFSIGGATVCPGRLCHPSVTYGYRIEENGWTFVYMSDNEPDVAPAGLLDEIIELARGADLLIHDCQYFESEYASRHRWGHSTPRQAVAVARAAGVRRLALFHHDPCHSDRQVEALHAETRTLAAPIEVVIAREGESYGPKRQTQRKPLARAISSSVALGRLSPSRPGTNVVK